MANYHSYERELNAAATRRDSKRRARGTAGDYYRERDRGGHTDTNLDRCPSGGGAAARWAASEEAPEWLDPGDHVFDYDLHHIEERCGVNVAAAVAAQCKPCEVCGLNTYGGGICNQCSGQEEDVRVHSKRGPVVTAELAGAYTPRWDDF